jgi:small subunit ribosomal protein S20
MPIKKAAKKYMRVTVRKTEKNKIAKGLFRSAIKKTKEAVVKGNLVVAKEELKKAIKALDKASEKNIIHKNTAARKKSRLNKLVKAASNK